MKIKNIFFVSILISISLSLLSACNSTSASNEESVNIATNPTGQGYNGAGTGIAEVLYSNSDMMVSIRPYTGPISWMHIFQNEQEVNQGFLSLPEAVWAYNGENVFDESDNVRALVKGNFNVSGGYVVRQDSGINSLKDLKGKKVATDYPGNPIVNDILSADLNSVGLSFGDVEAVPTSDPNAGLQALREGRVDAAFTGSPLAAGVLELHTNNPIKALPYGDYDATEFDNLPDQVTEELQEFIPGADLTLFEGGYVEEETILIRYPTVLIGSSELLSEEEAYNTVKALWENYEEMHSAHSWLKSWNPDTMFDPDIGVPYHEGAIKYYKEIGVWNDEAETNQQKFFNE